MALAIKWTDEYDAIMLAEFERVGKFGEVAKTVTAAGLPCSHYSVRKRYMRLRPDDYERALLRHRPNPLTPEQERRVVQMLRAGASGAKVMSDLGISRSMVERVRKQRGFARSRAPVPVVREEPTVQAAPRKRLVAYYNGQRAPVSQADHFPRFDRVAVEMI